MEVLVLMCALLLTVVKCCPSNCICEEHETTCEIQSCTDELPLEYTDFLVSNGELCPKQRKFLKDLTPNTIIVMTSHPCIGIHNCHDDRPPEPEQGQVEPGQPELQPGHLEPGQPEPGHPEQPEGGEPEGGEPEPRQPEQPEGEEPEPRQPEPELERVAEPELEFITEVTTDVTTIEVTEPDNMIVPVPDQSTMTIYRG